MKSSIQSIAGIQNRIGANGKSDGMNLVRVGVERNIKNAALLKERNNVFIF